MFRVCLFLFLLACGNLRAAGNRLVLDEGFEAGGNEAPPEGWAIWGNEKYKVPANYERDLKNPHTGNASLRIRHPANTGGYLAMAPNRLIDPQPGVIYTVTFWAKTDRPGRIRAGLFGYKSLSPFTEAQSPPAEYFTVTREWQSCRLSARAGLDFFPDECKKLQLFIDAAADRGEERTLWVDDIQIAEEADPHPANLVNDATLKLPPLEHWLMPGKTLSITVDPEKTIGPATAEAGGVSFHRVAGYSGVPYDAEGKFTLAPAMEEAVREMRLPMTRFYALADEKFRVEEALDRVVDICRRVNVPQDRCVLEFERQSAGAVIAPEVWARGIRYSLEKGYGFHHWEICNEPYSSLWGEGAAFPTPEIFIEHFKKVSHAVREADPKAQIGLDIHPTDLRWGNYLLSALAGEYDFVAPHYYCHAPVRKLPFEEIVLTENFRLLNRARQIDALIHAYNPDRPVDQYDTEWGLLSDGPNGNSSEKEIRNANIVGTLHRAVRLIYYARGGFLRGASGWSIFSEPDEPGCAFLSPQVPEQRFLLYWLQYEFNRRVGKTALKTEGTAPWHDAADKDDRAELSGPLTPVLATLSADRREIYLIVANGSWTRAAPSHVALDHFSAVSAEGVILSQKTLDANPLLKKKEDAVANFPVAVHEGALDFTLPPHSVLFITVSSAKGASAK